jgi:NhaP-type Na+/H+ or K+/H+ antiporter
MLGLDNVGKTGLNWVMIDVVWATVAGIGLGVVCGVLLARMIWKIRGQSRELMGDFLGLGMIGVVYGLSVMIGAWGFLAVFFAAVALHQTELKLASEVMFKQRKHKQDKQRKLDKQAKQNKLNQVKLVTSTLDGLATPIAESVTGNHKFKDEPPPTVSEGSLVFKEHLERLSEVILVLLVGGMLFTDSWSWGAVGFALFLFLVARPVSVMIGMLGSGASWRKRCLTGWFGVRGIGSLYYLMYAIQHGLPESLSLQFLQLTLIVITLSIVFHGISAQPLMTIFWRRKP